MIIEFRSIEWKHCGGWCGILPNDDAAAESPGWVYSTRKWEVIRDLVVLNKVHHNPRVGWRTSSLPWTADDTRKCSSGPVEHCPDINIPWTLFGNLCLRIFDYSKLFSYWTLTLHRYLLLLHSYTAPSWPFRKATTNQTVSEYYANGPDGFLLSFDGYWRGTTTTWLYLSEC